jgi:hypothetical protein
MSIETVCQGCGKRLRVGDQHAGKLAKCPQCQAVYTVPQSAVAASWGAGASTTSALAAGDRWHLKTPDGLSFGPVARVELDRWMGEGRITAQSQILHEGDGQWLWATQIYPHLQSMVLGSPFKSGALPGAVPGGGANPYAPSAATPLGTPYYQGYLEPHHGVLVLVLGIMGVFCVFLAIPAIIVAFTDLRKMKRGVMDPSGRGLTIAGLCIAILPVALMIFQFVMIAVRALQ